MSQYFSITAYLKVCEAITQVDSDFWSETLQAAIIDPEETLVHGVKKTLSSHPRRNDVEFYEEDLGEGEFNENHQKPDDGQEVTGFTFSYDRDFTEGETIEKYAANAVNVLYQAALSKGVRISFGIDYWQYDYNPDGRVSVNWKDMIPRYRNSTKASKTKKPEMVYHSPQVGGLHQVRFSGYYPNADHATDFICIILGESWLNSTPGKARRQYREMEDWVRNNREIMEGFVLCESVDNPNCRLFEELQYPCDHCSTATTLRDAYLVAIDTNGLPIYGGFPKYLCKKCTIEAIGDDNI